MTGATGTKGSWEHMKDRCDNPNNDQYYDYGGRGIRYDTAWRSFDNFLADMGERPPGMTLERKDNSMGYYRENCVWATRLEQAYNRRVKSHNRVGIAGVYIRSTGRIWGYHDYLGKRVILYSGYDFFEACCARKSWEVKQLSTAQ